MSSTVAATEIRGVYDIAWLSPICSLLSTSKINQISLCGSKLSLNIISGTSINNKLLNGLISAANASHENYKSITTLWHINCRANKFCALRRIFSHNMKLELREIYFFLFFPPRYCFSNFLMLYPATPTEPINSTLSPPCSLASYKLNPSEWQIALLTSKHANAGERWFLSPSAVGAR